MKCKILKCVLASLTFALTVTACAELNYDQDTTYSPDANDPMDSRYTALLEQARWGNGDAYLHLAEYHHNTNKDFLRELAMVAMAEQYGGISSMEEYIGNLPTDNHLKVFFDAMAYYDKKDTIRTVEAIERMLSQSLPEGYTLKGIITTEQGDTIGGKQALSIAAEKGSTLAAMLLATFPDYWGAIPTTESLTPFAERSPVACKLLGDAYAGISGEENTDEELAAMYYRKADEQGCLGKRASRWLMGYYLKNAMDVGERELERLARLAGFQNDQMERDHATQRCEISWETTE